jgi:hypothetical protein
VSDLISVILRFAAKVAAAEGDPTASASARETLREGLGLIVERALPAVTDQNPDRPTELRKAAVSAWEFYERARDKRRRRTEVSNALGRLLGGLHPHDLKWVETRDIIDAAAREPGQNPGVAAYFAVLVGQMRMAETGHDHALSPRQRASMYLREIGLEAAWLGQGGSR